MRNHHSDTDRLDELREFFDDYDNYSEYNNADSDRYENKYDNNTGYYDNKNQKYTNNNEYRNVNRQNSYFGNKNTAQDDYYETPVSKSAKKGCSCSFGCCLGVVIIISVFLALMAVLAGGLGVVMAIFFNLLSLIF